MKTKLLKLGIETALESKAEELHSLIQLGGMNHSFPDPIQIRDVVQDINELVNELDKLGSSEVIKTYMDIR